ncbi:MAG: hypothetical protein ACTHK7_16410, partial [Aureliella sp.]
MAPQVLLPPVGDDSALVRRYLEHFFQADDKLDDFAKYLGREYLTRVLAETKILYGAEDPAAWYAKLSPAEQKALRERVELRFAPQNKVTWTTGDSAELLVEVKNVPQLLIKIYEVNPRNYYRAFKRPIGTDIDLDGLVANAHRELDYSQAADRRHLEKIALPELDGRGVWVVDLLGGGQRSRALVQKGSLSSVQQLTDAGHLLQIYDESGEIIKTAHVEINDRAFEPDSEGRILIPYSETTHTENILLVDGDFASQEPLALQSESYQLQAGFVIDRQALVAGTQAGVLIRSRLTCNGRPVSLQLLEKPRLTITAVDMDGISTSQTSSDLKLGDAADLLHRFLVPQRLASIQFTLVARVYNQSLDVRQDVSASETVQCNDIDHTASIGGFFLREVDKGYRLLVLGRNGEPMPKLPVSLVFTTMDVNHPETVTLATDADGQLDLGSLPRETTLVAGAQGVQPATFRLERRTRSWPDVLHAEAGKQIVLPLGRDREEASAFTLTELRHDAPYRVLDKKVDIGAGKLTIGGLEPGSFVLRDHRYDVRVRIAVVDSSDNSAGESGYLIGHKRALEIRPRQQLAITETRVDDKELRIKLTGSDAHTRVHVLVNPFVPTLDPAEQSRLGYPPVFEQTRSYTRNLFVDSLQLDEEYSYILQRQQAAKYPGNLLPQPSLLVHPWEVSVSENQSKQAAAGEAIPPMSAPAPAAPTESAAAAGGKAVQAPQSTSYDFLAQGTLVAANLKPDDEGMVVVPLEKLKGYSSVTVLAVHPTTTDSREVALPETELHKRDLRLKESFPAESHLAEKQSVRVLKADEKVDLGDARTSRVQLYTTLADVYRLYGTFLNNAEWEKFRFVTEWPQLSDEEKRSRYSEMSCHELDFFLYRKDRKFFDNVVAPLLAQKLDKQLVDRWLLDKSLEGYGTLWRIERLNTLERVLLAERLKGASEGTKRWLDEYLAAHPLDPVARSQRFETALRGTLLDVSGDKSMMYESLALSDEVQRRAGAVPFGSYNGPMGGMGGAMSGYAAGSGPGVEPDFNSAAPRLGTRANARAGAAKSRLGVDAVQLEAKAEKAEAEEAKDRGRQLSENDVYFRAERLKRSDALGKARFFQTLDQTREWAESQFYHVRLQNQAPELIPPSLFWQEFLTDAAGEDFLSQNLDLPVTNVNEALCALAVLDLPWESPRADMNVNENRLVVSAERDAIAYVQSIEPTEEVEENSSILAGRDIYLAEPHTDEESNRALQDQPLLIGVPYRANVVVTNPSGTKQRVKVLYQLPEGAMPLASSKVTRSTTIELNPYSTAQVQYVFYFPEPGKFEHYGGQVASEANGKHLTATKSQSLRVLAEPESVDETTWSYVAAWGTNEQVLAYLKKANLQRLDVSRIAFRMKDKSFYEQVIELLARAQRFDAVLWGYSLKHLDTDDIAQLLHHRRDFTGELGPVLASRLITIDPQQEMSYEHLDYRPLVVARIHQLGRKRVVLNDRLFTQYSHMLDELAHGPKIDDDRRMELCYYLLLQNRIEEALDWFDEVDVDNLVTRLQYDYFDAYLDFFRGKYDRASAIAERYAAYPVPRWRELFAQVTDQVRQRDALLSGQELTSVTSLESSVEREERLLTDRREAQQTRQAAESPALDLAVADGVASVQFRNLDSVRVNYYLMDIELLFSRNPFV